MNGMSQERLGDSLGISFQQIQKYERGTNRVGASRLQNIANILNVPVSFFFENAPDQGASLLDPSHASPQDDLQAFLSSPEGFRLNQEFVKIKDSKVRHRIIEMIKPQIRTRGRPSYKSAPPAYLFLSGPAATSVALREGKSRKFIADTPFDAGFRPCPHRDFFALGSAGRILRKKSP